MTTVDYTLYYWPVPFRGHFIRAILTYAGANWEEAENVAQVMSADATDQAVPFMGPPMLINHRAGDFAISQMPAIAYYLGEKLGLLPESLEDKAMALKVVNDANDLIDEITLQGGMEMWTEEKWQNFLPRLLRWMSFWEVNGSRHGLTEDSGYFLGTSEPTIADIVTATLWVTMTERLPLIGRILEEEAPKTFALSRRIFEIPSLAVFNRESWNKYGDDYCGGQIGESLKKILNQ